MTEKEKAALHTYLAARHVEVDYLRRAHATQGKPADGA